MPNCEGCGLRYTQQTSDNSELDALCESCAELDEGTPSVQVSPLEYRDLELVLAWRSHPELYTNFRQQNGPLEWDRHLSWYESRDADRYDFIIHFGGRRVGAININTTDEVGIFLGDFSAHGNGVATVVLEWLCKEFADRTPLSAEIRDENEASKRLFERCGFRQGGRDGEWLQYVYDP